MARLFNLLPDPEAVLALEPEDLAGLALEIMTAEEGIQKFHPANFMNPASLNEYPQAHQRPIIYALAEAWNWLIREGLIAAVPDDQFGWHFVTRRGLQLKNRPGVEAYRKSTVLPRSMLHPQILEACWPSYVRGEYDTAVFKAFRELEIEIRKAGGFAAELVGTDLARKAFHENGPLSDQSIPAAERQALQSMMAGAIGSYKNPHSHRKVVIDAVDAAEMLILASHLLKIVERRFLEHILG